MVIAAKKRKKEATSIDLEEAVNVFAHIKTYRRFLI